MAHLVNCTEGKVLFGFLHLLLFFFFKFIVIFVLCDENFGIELLCLQKSTAL